MARKIKFIKQYTVQAIDGPTYKEGQVVSLEDRSCDHFINRGVAEEYTSPKPKPKPGLKK